MTKSCTCHQTPTPSYSQIGKPKESSVIGEILALAARPEVISFAGGLPSAEGFPVKAIKDAADWVLETCPQVALQYSAVGGMPALLEAIAKIETDHGVPTTPDEVMIVSGSQQALDMIARVFTDEGDKVLVETPTYMGALYAFELCKPKFVSLPTDDEGLNPDLIDDRVAGAKFAYVMPTYQNPTGRCMSLERRKKMMELVTKYEIPVFEDNPYGDLRFEGEEIAPLITMDPKHLVMYSGTFSKTLAPGMRLAWMVCNDEILAKMDLVKGSTDLATPSVTQREVAMYMKNYDFEGHVQDNCKLYGHRRDVMCNAIKEYFPKDVKCTYPHGGLFLWVELPEGCNSRDLFKYALERKVAYVPGDAFFPESGKKNFFRLNFSYNDDDVTVEGVKRLADALKAYLADQK